MAKIEWRGNEIKNKMRSATRQGIDVTLASCVNTGKTFVLVETAVLQGSLMFKPAQDEGNEIVGHWGSFDVDYAIYQEIGPVSGVKIWNYKPYLRPSADQHYPELAGNIKSRYGSV